MSGTVHIVGAGLGGLSAAVDLVDAGYSKIVFYEAAKAAGGRCRSFMDTVLNIVVDNGSHLLLSGNHAAVRYLKKIDGLKEMTQCEAEIPFADLEERRALDAASQCEPRAVVDSRRQAPCAGFQAQRLSRSRSACCAPSAVAPRRRGDGHARPDLYERLWRPVMLAALNVEPAEADAKMAITLVQGDVRRAAARPASRSSPTRACPRPISIRRSNI